MECTGSMSFTAHLKPNGRDREGCSGRPRPLPASRADGSQSLSAKNYLKQTEMDYGPKTCFHLHLPSNQKAVEIYAAVLGEA